MKKRRPDVLASPPTKSALWVRPGFPSRDLNGHGEASRSAGKNGDRQIGIVKISRKRGRIAGWAKPRVPVQILWCGTNRPRKKTGSRQDGWSFPPAVRELLLQQFKGKRLLHLFGGHADFGYRLDIDPATKPDLLGDAWIAGEYFKKNSFDVVVLDPPYYSMNQQEKTALLRVAGWLAKETVVWFHTVEIDCSIERLRPQRMWLVRVGTQCAVRVLQFLQPAPNKLPPLKPGQFERGPALRYDRWKDGQQGLFGGMETDLPAVGQISAGDQGKVGKVFLGDWCNDELA